MIAFYLRFCNISIYIRNIRMSVSLCKAVHTLHKPMEHCQLSVVPLVDTAFACQCTRRSQRWRPAIAKLKTALKMTFTWAVHVQLLLVSCRASETAETTWQPTEFRIHGTEHTRLCSRYVAEQRKCFDSTNPGFKASGPGRHDARVDLLQ